MGRRLSENRLFFREYLRTFRTTGAILPSGRRLAAALAHYVVGEGTGRQILEVGPGTGAVTRRIAVAMRPDDRLDLVELNETFVARLRAGLAEEPGLRAIADRTRVLHTAIEELPGQSCYDVIISGLPLNNFAPSEVEHILSRLSQLLKPGGTISFFEYIAIRFARGVVSGRSERARLRGIGQVLRTVLDGHEIRRDWVLANVPPAWVHHVRFA
jgi:phosphatidylethanolamine/phosphatidyl-N-methylethanolamine N-methyltransferase